MQNWLLPEYIEDILPAQARRLESLRRLLLDLFRVHGYQLVIPPSLEYLESLLTGTGHDMDLQTFKLVDQLSGRLMGLRADITPQVARIDAHLLNRQGVTRLCYAGSVLHALPAGLTATRELFQVGAELYGHAGLESDLEIQRLMLEALQRAGIAEVQLDLGHVAVFRRLARRAELPPQAEADLFRALQAKDIPAIRALTASLEAKTREALALLPELYGGDEVLVQARKRLPRDPEIVRALDELSGVARKLKSEVGELCFDLAELRGYHYHSGIVFAAYAKPWPAAVAQGGRYDHVGAAFGRSRPATGFSMDIRQMAADMTEPSGASGILAPCVSDPGLAEKIRELRQQGEVVVVELPGHEAARHELGCERRLVLRDGQWAPVAMDQL